MRRRIPFPGRCLVGVETEMRSDIWLREFRDGLAALVASDLTGVGVSLRQHHPAHGAAFARHRCVALMADSGAHNRQGEYTGGYGVTGDDANRDSADRARHPKPTSPTLNLLPSSFLRRDQSNKLR